MAGLACPLCGSAISSEAGVGSHTCGTCQTEVDIARNPTRIVGHRVAKVRNPHTVRIASKRKVKIRRRNPVAECPSCGQVQEVPPGLREGYCAGCHTKVEVPETISNPIGRNKKSSIPVMVRARRRKKNRAD